MTDTPSITPSSTAKQLNPIISDDRLAFRSAVDHLKTALTADWQVILRLNQRHTPDAKKFGQDAAEAWALCLEALREVRDMENAHFDLRQAALELIETTPVFDPYLHEIYKCDVALQELCESHKVKDIGLYDLLLNAFQMNQVHYANIGFFQRPVVN